MTGSIYNNLHVSVIIYYNLRLVYQRLLDLTSMKNQNKLSFDIYRKPTSKDLLLLNIYCHPHEHKKSVINHLYNRMHTYKLTKENKNKEKEIIAQILKNNE
jgi:hypothetical protein